MIGPAGRTSARPCRGPSHHGEDPPITSAPLCDPCHRRARGALRSLPESWVRLQVAMQPGASAGEPVTGSRTPPLPLDAAPEALMAEIAEVILCWYEVLADQHHLARLPGPVVSIVPVEAAGSRALQAVIGRPRPNGRTVARAVRVLAAHFDHLLALPSTSAWRTIDVTQLRTLSDDVPRWVTESGETQALVDIDGVGGALEIVTLRSKITGLLGDFIGKERVRDTAGRLARCPVDGCGMLSLIRVNGSEIVECEACDFERPYGDYQRLIEQLGRLAERKEAG